MLSEQLRNSVCLLVAFLTISCTHPDEVECGFVSVSYEGKIYYEAIGEGEPVILLHGHSLDMRMWDQQVQPLVDAGYRVIRPEMRGYGHSSKQNDSILFTHVDDMIVLMDSLHIEKAHVVGLSMGSFVASEMVALHSDRLISATLASGNIRKRPGPSTPPDSTELANKRTELSANAEKGVEAWKKEWIEKLISGGGSNAESIRESITQQIMEWDGWQILHGEGRYYYANEAWDSLRLHCPNLPVLILSGELEHKSPKNPMMKFLPNSTIYAIPDCGHMSNMERPDVFNQLLINHLHSL